MFYLKNTIINYIKTIEIFKKEGKMKMRIKKIKDNFYEELGMSKYDFFNNLVNEIFIKVEKLKQVLLKIMVIILVMKVLYT